jgi:hypothetical protein
MEPAECGSAYSLLATNLKDRGSCTLIDSHRRTSSVVECMVCRKRHDTANHRIGIAAMIGRGIVSKLRIG